jgi:hypothetical protein
VRCLLWSRLFAIEVILKCHGGIITSEFLTQLFWIASCAIMLECILKRGVTSMRDYEVTSIISG